MAGRPKRRARLAALSGKTVDLSAPPSVAKARQDLEAAYRLWERIHDEGQNLQGAAFYANNDKWFRMRDRVVLPAERAFYQALKREGWKRGDPVPGGKPRVHMDPKKRQNPPKPRTAAQKDYREEQSFRRYAERIRAEHGSDAGGYGDVPPSDVPSRARARDTADWYLGGMKWAPHQGGRLPPTRLRKEAAEWRSFSIPGHTRRQAALQRAYAREGAEILERAAARRERKAARKNPPRRRGTKSRRGRQ